MSNGENFSSPQDPKPSDDDYVKDLSSNHDSEPSSDSSEEELKDLSVDDELRTLARESTTSDEPRKIEFEVYKKRRRAKMIPLLGGLFIILLVGGIIGYLLYLQKEAKGTPSKVIIFTVEPKDAEILVGEKKMTSALRKDGRMEVASVEPSKYTVTFRKKGYADRIFKDIETFFDRQTVLGSVTLTKLPYNCIVFKMEPQDAVVYVKGKATKVEMLEDGRVKIAGLEPGPTTLKVEKKDYTSFNKDDVVISKDTATELEPVILSEKQWKPIEIEVSPSTVEVFINGVKAVTRKGSGSSIVTDPMEPGIYKMHLVAEGYEGWIKNDVEVFADISTTVGPISMPKLVGGKIIVDADDQCEFFVDKKKVTPVVRSDRRLEIKGLKPGLHSLKISKKEFHDLIWDKVKITADRPVEILNIPWQAMTGKTVILTTTPGEVSIYVDDELKGKTSAIPGTSFEIKDLTVERHVIRAEKEGYTPWKDEEVMIYEDKPVILPQINLGKVTALKVSGEPEEVELFVAGKEKPYTVPSTITDILPGDVSVTLKKKGFKPYTKKVKINANEENVLEYKLEASKK
ncbi:MAG: PEGA domain-containing protein [Vulcanimicrobiota bacterium]